MAWQWNSDRLYLLGTSLAAGVGTMCLLVGWQSASFRSYMLEKATPTPARVLAVQPGSWKNRLLEQRGCTLFVRIPTTDTAGADFKGVDALSPQGYQPGQFVGVLVHGDAAVEPLLLEGYPAFFATGIAYIIYSLVAFGIAWLAYRMSRRPTPKPPALSS